MNRLRDCRAMLIALEREKCEQLELPAPRVEEVLRYALANYNRVLSAKMKRSGVELATTDRIGTACTFSPPCSIGPRVDD